MIRSTLIALTVLASAPALAGEPVVLRERLNVDGAQITLGDLFENAGAAAETPIARAPAPGARTSLDVSYVQRMAAQNNLDWANAGYLRRVTVSRNSRVISGETLTDILEGELMMTEGRRHEVRLSNTALMLHAPVDSLGGLEVLSLNFDPRSGLIAVEVQPYSDADIVRVTGRAYATMDIPVLARPVPAGEVIDADDIDWIAVRADRVRPDAITDPESIIGSETRRALRANEPLRGYDLQEPVVISRGEIIALTFQAPGIQLSVRARALEDAAEGELARFVNLQSNRTVEALVEGPGRANVGFSAASF
jgi:flagella basal body P-ring formation protein FlgA